MELAYYTETLLSWYLNNKRELPWRQTKDPYKVWLSEIILQQTRVAQGLPYYNKFIEKFPTVFELSGANEQAVLLLWQGLGYYSRARNLYKCAQTIVNEYNGIFPGSYGELIKLPGIGPYTAAAIASIAFNEKTPVLDGNVYRVISRLFDIEINTGTNEGKKHYYDLANALMSETYPGDFNQAIMEFGALQCLPGKPDCASCVLNVNCLSLSRKSQHMRPVKQKKPQKTLRYFDYLVIEFEGALYLNKREKNDIWKGLFDFILFESKTKNRDIEQVVFRHKLISNIDLHMNNIREYKHILTHQIILASFYHIKLINSTSQFDEVLVNGGKFYSFEQIMNLPKPVLIDKYLKEVIF